MKVKTTIENMLLTKKVKKLVYNSSNSKPGIFRNNHSSKRDIIRKLRENYCHT